MIEGLFILTTIFVAYVVYVMIGEQKATAKSKAPQEKPEVQAAAVELPRPQVAVATEKPVAIKPAATKSVAPKAATPKPVATKTAAPEVATKAAAAKATTVKPAAVKKAPAQVTAKSAGLKNPQTAEIATTYSNYRFTKRWIKDALVAEGLLEKVYKNNELNTETEATIKEAIGKLEAMDKYKV
ncbi:MAG: hypothetical protein PSU93_03400 [Methylobacter sp.]|uniref:Uncharacterized protein n=1 Tax=Candidatus Methylobacter titanis TaxID=3053457 RepID=A0AA43Q5N7_9GAMM|nr:hypothetical protein [Candidatus Methylobacter titanis]